MITMPPFLSPANSKGPPLRQVDRTGVRSAWAGSGILAGDRCRGQAGGWRSVIVGR